MVKNTGEFTELYEQLDLTEYNSEELEEFGRKLSILVVNSIGLLRYHKKNLVIYDITVTDLGKLTDEVEELINGLTFYKTNSEYIEHIKELLNVVENFNINKENSVKKNLYTNITAELRDMIRKSNQKKLIVNNSPKKVELW